MDIKLRIKVALTFLFCVVLSACTGTVKDPSPTQTLLSLDTKTPEIRTIPSQLPTHASSPTFKSTVQPSHTPAGRQPTKTVRAYPPPLTKPANEATETLIASFPVICDEFGPYATSMSPSGNWLAIPCGDRHDRSLEIVNRDGKRWVIPFDNYGLFPGTSLEGVYPIHWTSDEKFLYFAPLIGFDGGGTCFWGYGYGGLYRINLIDGEWTLTLPPAPSIDGYTIAFSPGGRRIAYIVENQLSVYDLQTGEKTDIQVGDAAVGSLAWSPDGSELAYATCKPNQDYTDILKSTVGIYSLKENTTRTIVEAEKKLFILDFWDRNQILRISDKYQDRPYTYLYYDGSSEKFTTPTPTPP